MKMLLLAGLLTVAGLASCSNQGGNKAEPPASVRAAVKQLVQQLSGKSATYTADLGWRSTPLSQQEASEIPVQRLLASWLADMQHANGYTDTLLSLNPDTLALRLYGPNWPQIASKAAIGADEAHHRADRLGLRISRMLDSLKAVASPQTLTSSASSSSVQCWQHYFQLTSRAGKIERDTATFILLPSQQVLLRVPLTERFWEQQRSADPF